MAVGGGTVERVGEKVGVGGDDAEEIVECVGDDLVFGEGECRSAGIVGRKMGL